MILALHELLLALEFKGFSSWDARTKAIVAIVGGILILAISLSFVRKVGIVVILVPVIIFGAIFAMNKNQGCLEKASEVHEDGAYQKGKTTKPGTPAPAPAK